MVPYEGTLIRKIRACQIKYEGASDRVSNRALTEDLSTVFRRGRSALLGPFPGSTVDAGEKGAIGQRRIRAAVVVGQNQCSWKRRQSAEVSAQEPRRPPPHRRTEGLVNVRSQTYLENFKGFYLYV